MATPNSKNNPINDVLFPQWQAPELRKPVEHNYAVDLSVPGSGQVPHQTIYDYSKPYAKQSKSGGTFHTLLVNPVGLDMPNKFVQVQIATSAVKGRKAYVLNSKGEKVVITPCDAAGKVAENALHTSEINTDGANWIYLLECKASDGHGYTLVVEQPFQTPLNRLNVLKKADGLWHANYSPAIVYVVYFVAR